MTERKPVSQQKKGTYILSIPQRDEAVCKQVAAHCPMKIIKVNP